MPERNTRASGLGSLVQRLRSRVMYRLLGWFLLVSLGPLLVTNSIGYWQSRRIIERRVEDDLRTMAGMQARVIHDRIEHDFLILEAITAGNDFLAAGAIRGAGGPAGEMGTVADRPTLERYLGEKVRELEYIESLRLVLPDGRAVAASGTGTGSDLIPMAGGRSVSWVRDPAAGDTVAPKLRLGVPVVGSGVGTVGYLAATLGTRDWFDIHQPDADGRQVTGYLLDDTGRPLLISPLPKAADWSSPLPTFPRDSGLRYRTRSGGEVLASVVPVTGYPWDYLVEAPADWALGPLLRLRELSLALLLLFVALIVITGGLVARDIVAPLRRLVAATHRVAEGDLRVRVTVEGPDELGQLARAFNDMAAGLEDTRARVRELHQREIQRASQLATVGELASGVAHEIKNPVVGIASGLDLVRRHIGPDPSLGPIMAEMARQLTRIQRTILNLLSFARPATPTLASVSGNHVVRRAVQLVQPIAAREGVTVHTELDPGEPRLMGDEDLLQQALVNLLMNAVAASDSGGRIIVATRELKGAFAISVHDSGQGIPAALREQVMKPFFTTRHTGSGLGLPITRDIVERHGGEFFLESEDGTGTTVTVRLPRRPPHATPPPGGEA